MAKKVPKKDPGDGGEERQFSKNNSWLSVVALNLLMIIIGVFIATIYPLYGAEDIVLSSSPVDQSASQLLGAKGALLFRSLDADRDGNITYAEFAPIVEKLTGEVPAVLARSRASKETGEAITLLTDFIPFVFESMKTYEDEGIDGMMRNFQALTGLRSWTSPAMSEASFYSNELRNFLPKAGDEEPGKVYWLYKPFLEPWYQGDSGRYFPPNPAAEEETLYKIMRMLHSRPFLLTRFGPHGTAAVVQGYNDLYYNIKFRMHTEFQVNEPPRLPFWVTPAQFTGNLVIRKDGLSVKHFSLDLPTDRKLNVDMEWITQLANEETGDKEHMEVEIGYQPKMSITMSGGEDIDSFLWKRNISDREAASALEKEFYPFKKVDYLNFEESFEKAAAENKLVHNIVLWGSLDDQSC